jgi:hypothetical protein
MENAKLEKSGWAIQKKGAMAKSAALEKPPFAPSK